MRVIHLGPQAIAELGEDITQVLPVETDEVVELTEEIHEPKRMTPEELDMLFYSCLRGYGWKG
jgi:hypothetical protein